MGAITNKLNSCNLGAGSPWKHLLDVCGNCRQMARSWD